MRDATHAACAPAPPPPSLTRLPSFISLIQLILSLNGGKLLPTGEFGAAPLLDRFILLHKLT
jgi:hypothetical protein